MAGGVINCRTKVGEGYIINTGSTVDHDNVIENYVHISPGAHIAGTVKIGAGAVVINRIDERGTYIGLPSRKLDK